MEKARESIAMLAISDGVLGLVAPRRHSLQWRFEPKGYRRLMENLAGRPALVRTLAAAEVVLGLWLALRQYGR